jgi:diguanylate cyclase (GGDEF)-like protein
VTTILLLALKAHLKHDRLQARKDSVTGLPNTLGFEEASDRLIRLAARHHHSLAVACIDVGDFRSVTDAQGRSAGDAVLGTVARTLSSGVRASDVVGRLDDDTFAVLMPETSRHGAQVAMAKIHEELVHGTEKQGWTLEISIGVALFSRAPTSVAGALQAAKVLVRQAMTQDKSGLLYEEQPAAGGTKGSGHQAFRQPGTSEHRVIRALSRR